LEKVLPLRRKINEIDEQILNFLKKRVEVCKVIGKTKRNHGIPVRDRQREDEHYRYIMRKALELGLDPHEVKAVYQEIIAMCINVQESEATEN